ncbi:hypothetical protein CHA01nite_35090 [Chryseobacterium hagamense]|uniref:Lipocalin-like domain-containing protein n=2 Tax=Chryseobacterium hagamense TaxID=395935 RepID=A0A511YRG6_9FLAO|nr:hypothetical protein CHA01nite_35090 [Chryseobacterium hagamense]
MLLLIFSCNKENKAYGTNDVNKDQRIRESVKTLKGNYCFMKTEDRDTTYVHLMISGSNVNGEMTWQPWEKDGAQGTLSGKLVSAHEMELLYDYTIEGSKQTEAKFMKIEGNKLYILTGELTDPENNGHLKYKNILKAVYSEVLTPTTCR